MADIRPVTPDFATAPQLLPADLAGAAASGFRLVINNRPDGEEPGQPTDAEMQAAAEDAGMHYLAIPFVGMPDAAQVEAVRHAVRHAHGPVLAFCRSGTRSITAWALAEMQGGRDGVELVRLGREAGYELAGPLGVTGRG